LHIDTLLSYHCVAEVLTKSGQNKAASDYSRRASEGMHTVLGPDHQYTKTALKYYEYNVANIAGNPVKEVTVPDSSSSVTPSGSEDASEAKPPISENSVHELNSELDKLELSNSKPDA
jgi:hypothetical protein